MEASNFYERLSGKDKKVLHDVLAKADSYSNTAELLQGRRYVRYRSQMIGLTQTCAMDRPLCMRRPFRSVIARDLDNPIGSSKTQVVTSIRATIAKLSPSARSFVDEA